MDKYSFLNAAHTGYFAEMYEKYLQEPDSVEASLRAFFQGFDFGIENNQNGLLSHSFSPGVLSQNESAVTYFYDWYFTNMKLP